MTSTTSSATQRETAASAARARSAAGGRRGARAAAAGRWTALALIVIGVGLRLAAYFSGRAFWLDEAFLWHNLKELPASALAGPLDLAQGAPIPFLLTEKGMLETFGDGEWALRLPSLVFGVAALLAVWRLATEVFGPSRAWAALAPVALSAPLVFYSSELKQYALDVLIATLVVWMLILASRRPLTGRRAVAIALAGAAAVWCSDPSVFVLAGGGLALLADAWGARARSRLRLLALACSAWLASFAAVYLVHVRDLSVVRGLATADTGDGSLEALKRIVRAAAQSPVGGGTLVPLLSQALMALGLVALWRSGRRVETGILALPVAVLLVAVLLGQYPVGGRFTTFLAAPLALAWAAGILALWDAIRTRNGMVVAVAVGVAAACAAPAVARLADTPPASEELDTVTTAIAARMRPGDQIYLSYATPYAYAYYGPRAGIGFAPRPTRGPGAGSLDEYWGKAAPVLSSTPGRVVGRWSPDASARPLDIDRMRGAPRFWIVFSHYDPDEATAMVRRARGFARPLDIVHADGAFAVLMERRS